MMSLLMRARCHAMHISLRPAEGHRARLGGQNIAKIYNGIEAHRIRAALVSSDNIRFYARRHRCHLQTTDNRQRGHAVCGKKGQQQRRGEKKFAQLT